MIFVIYEEKKKKIFDPQRYNLWTLISAQEIVDINGNFFKTLQKH